MARRWTTEWSTTLAHPLGEQPLDVVARWAKVADHSVVRRRVCCAISDSARSLIRYWRRCSAARRWTTEWSTTMAHPRGEQQLDVVTRWSKVADHSVVRWWVCCVATIIELGLFRTFGDSAVPMSRPCDSSRRYLTAGLQCRNIGRHGCQRFYRSPRSNFAIHPRVLTAARDIRRRYFLGSRCTSWLRLMARSSALS